MEIIEIVCVMANLHCQMDALDPILNDETE